MKSSVLKSIFYMLLSSFIGIIANPEILMASDSVKLVGIDNTNIVETVILPEENKTSIPVAGVAVKPVVNTVLQQNNTLKDVSSVKIAQPVSSNRADFAWGSQDLIKVSSTAVNAGKNVARIGKLLYGHNYTDFGNITSLKVGDVFTIVENGVATSYRVVANPINGDNGVVLDKKGETVLSYSGDARYSDIDVNALVNYGMGHSLALLTCYGTNSRYVVVADAI